MRSLRLVGWIVAAWVTSACGGGSGTPLEGRPFRADDFPEGEAFIFGVVLGAISGTPLANLPVTLTPSDGLPLDQELASPVQAEVHTNRRGEFAFSGIAAGTYVLFVRFDANHRGYGEVVGRVTASPVPSELQLLPAPIALEFRRPSDGGTIAFADTALLGFNRIRVEELLTLAPGTRPLHARVLAYGQRGSSHETPARPLTFEVPVGEDVLREGSVRVPIEVGGLGDPVRLESYLALHLVYRDPRGAPGIHQVVGEAISVLSR